MKSGRSISRLTKRVFGLLAPSAAILCASVSPAQASELFYTTCCHTGARADLIAIKVQNGHQITTKLIGPICCGGTAALALSPSRILYGMVGNLFVSQQLATIDRATGNTNLFGVPVAGLSVMAMGFAPDGTLYAVGGCYPNAVGACTPGTPNFNSLYRVDVGTGAFTLVGSTGAPLFFMDLTFDGDGNMYGVTCDLSPSAGDLSTLYRIDHATGAATKIVDLVGSTSIMGLSFDRKKNKLYATDFYSINSALYLVDMKTGFLAPIATTGYGYSSGLVSVPARSESEQDE
jgi:DNA-binding beta-propeller fold protein YncE